MTRPWIPIRAVICAPLKVQSRAVRVMVAWKRRSVPLAGYADGEGPGARPDRNRRAGQVVVGRRRRFTHRLRFRAEQLAEAVAERRARIRRAGAHAAAAAAGQHGAHHRQHCKAAPAASNARAIRPHQLH
jgi:hypothetical protein